jgi:Alpha/beta hydrolase domain
MNGLYIHDLPDPRVYNFLMRRTLLLLMLLASLAGARVRKVEILERTPVVGGYERLTGRVHFGVDPKLAANRIIRDLEYAPVDSAGEVEFTSDVFLLRPADAAKSNGTVLFEVSNRGGKGMLNRFDFARAAADPREPGDFGDRWLLEQGYTLAWLAWEWDIPANARTSLHFDAPHFRADALPAAGLVRSEFVPDRTTKVMPLSDRNMIPVAVAKPLALYVRQAADRPAQSIPAGQWHLGADGASVEMPAGFEPGGFYEFVYEGKDPVVTGAGMAAVRDWISYLKHDENGEVKRAIGFGISQSGRFLREFLYDGFNADEQGRIVFDGVWADVAGAGRGSFNFRYAQPSRDGQPYSNVFYPTDLFPFVDTALLEKARVARVAPKLFLTNNSYEYWGRAAALIHITPDGRRDAPLSPETRFYFTAGVQHFPRSLPLVKAGTRYLVNPVDHRPVQRALLAALQAWLRDGAAPPPSVYPRISEGQLTTLAGLKFPKMEGVEVPPHPRLARKVDFGPRFSADGVILREPPEVSGSWPLLVPQVDADGIDLGGIRLPEVAVPVATLTGWNLREAGIGAPDEMTSFYGSIFPFPKEKILQRYGSREEYLKRAGAAADQLVAQRFVLSRDRDYVVERAARLWDAVVVNGGR